MVSVAAVRPDQVTLGVLVSTVHRDVVDAAVAGRRAGAKRSDGKLPPHVTAYLTMALCLFADDDYEEVAAKVTGALGAWGCWDAGWSAPTASGITRARKRLGSQVMQDVFEGVARPVATPGTRGAWLRDRRLLAVDGFDLDLPDTPGNAQEFGYAGSGDNRSAFPKARVVALSECGTHAFLAAEVGAWSTGEKTLAAGLWPRLQPGELLTADRGFYSWAAWASAARSGGDLLWRAPAQLALPVVQVLPDGTFTAVLVEPGLRGARRQRVLHDARAGLPPDPDEGHLVRVVEYDVPDRDGGGTGELIVLLTTILDPAQARPDELAAAYHQRWEQETGHDQLKTHLRGPGRVLRSRLPDLVKQEIWAWLTVHHAISALIARAAEAADIDPDRISFVRALRIVRRTATGTAASPPLSTGTRECRRSSRRSPPGSTPPAGTAPAPGPSSAPATTATASRSATNRPAPGTPDRRPSTSISSETQQHDQLTLRGIDPRSRSTPWGGRRIGDIEPNTGIPCIAQWGPLAFRLIWGICQYPLEQGRVRCRTGAAAGQSTLRSWPPWRSLR